MNDLELNLLAKINQGLDDVIHQRLAILTVKQKSETISKEEYEELLKLVKIVENNNVERLQYLWQLAQLKKMPVRTLMKELNIKF